MLTCMPLDHAELGRWLPEILLLIETQRSREDSLLLLHEPGYYAAFSPTRGRYFAARIGSTLAGFQLVGFADGIHPLWTPYIERIGGGRGEFSVSIQCIVLPTHRAQGIGMALRQAALRHLRTQGVRHSLVTVHPDNLPNLRLCERLGYREIDRGRVYDSQVPRVLLHLDMASPPWAPA